MAKIAKYFTIHNMHDKKSIYICILSVPSSCGFNEFQSSKEVWKTKVWLKDLVLVGQCSPARPCPFCPSPQPRSRASSHGRVQSSHSYHWFCWILPNNPFEFHFEFHLNFIEFWSMFLVPVPADPLFSRPWPSPLVTQQWPDPTQPRYQHLYIYIYTVDGDFH